MLKRKNITAPPNECCNIPFFSRPPAETLGVVGQPTGIALDIYDNPVIFHRGDRIWDGSTFKR